MSKVPVHLRLYLPNIKICDFYAFTPKKQNATNKIVCIQQTSFARSIKNSILTLGYLARATENVTLYILCKYVM